MTFEKRLQQYRKTYDVDDLVNPNDIANLHTLIRNQLLIDQIQAKVDELMKSDDVLQVIVNVKKLQDSLRDLIDQNLAIERTLGIDRKSRKKDTTENVAEYILHIKKSAKEFLDSQLVTVYCQNCKVQVGRILPTHEHTEYQCKFQCSQCNKFVTATRKERDVFFDMKPRDKEWRKKYPVDIEQGKETTTLESEEDDTVLEDTDA